MSARWVNRGLDALTWLVLAVMLAPIFWLVASSLQTDGQLSTGAMNLLEPTFSAFTRMWESVDFERYMINSLIICTAAALCATIFASLAGYALARFRFRGRTGLSLGVIGTQLIPGSLFLLPVFMGFIWLKQNTPIALFDTHLGMILVYTAFFTPVAIYFMRYFFAAIPKDLEEAAMVDGCTRLGAFVKIVLPAAAPGLVATFVYAFLFAWDELLFVAALDAVQRRDDPDRHPQLHRQLPGKDGPADGGRRGLDPSRAHRLLRDPALAREGHHRGGGEGMTATAPHPRPRERASGGVPLRRGDRVLPDRGRRARGRARRVDLGPVLPTCPAPWPTATPATWPAITTTAGRRTST